MTLKPDKTGQDIKIQENIFNENRCQSPQSNISESNLATYKNNNTWQPRRFYPKMQDLFNIWKISVIHINELKEKNHMTMSTDS